jgi:hypothetical protein
MVNIFLLDLPLIAIGTPHAHHLLTTIMRRHTTRTTIFQQNFRVTIAQDKMRAHTLKYSVAKTCPLFDMNIMV